MATTGTVALANEVKPQYDPEYYAAGQSRVYWDQLTDLRKVMNGERGSSHNFPIVESLQPNTTPLDELTDVPSQQMRANEIAITLQEFGGAIDLTKFLEATSYADVMEQAAIMNGYNLAESVDMIVRAVAGQGSQVFFQNGRTARSSFDGQATAADRVTAAFIEKLATFGRTRKMPLFEDNTLATVIHPFVHYDMLQDSDIRTMSSRQHPEILFNGEMAYWGGIRIIVSTGAKAFWGQGAVAASSLVTTLAAAAAVSDTNLKLTSVTNLVVGNWLSIRDASEAANTWSDTNELFYVTAVGTSGAGGTGVDGFALDPGPGDTGGLRYAHASGTVANDSNSVYPICLVGPSSITKAASSFTGPYGETVVSGPFDKLGRFLTFGWYLIAGYGRTRNSWLLRGEVGSSTS